LSRSILRSLSCGRFGLGALLLLSAPLFAQTQFGPQGQGYGFGENKISYRNFDWHIYHSPHFNVYYYPGEESLLQKVVSFAESDYDDLSRALNFQIKEPVPLIYYATHSAFEQNNVILNFLPEGVGAFAVPTRFRMVLPVDDPDGELIALIRHELTHIFQYQILYQGSLAKAITSGPPTWFIEGMASYLGRDETSRDQMFIRDAVVNDRIPSLTKGDFGGFMAYRIGHAAFAFIEDRWGHEGFLDFFYEMRNTFGSKVDRAVKRAFKMDPEDFDTEFRRWLRKKYLPQLVATGEPGDFGKVFRVKGESATYETSPVASPSGDLVASFSAYRNKVDVILFDAKKRTFIRNLTRGYSNKYQYPVAQELEIGRRLGRDLAFSPDGNTIALFAKREKGRSLLLLDALNGGIKRIVEMDEIEQQLSPSFSPDGKKIAFSGVKDGKFDIFLLDLDTATITQLTNDETFDGAPSFSPDGKSIVLVSVVGAGAHAKVFRIDLAKPGERIPVTTGESNENDPIYSPDGKRIYFTSDKGGNENIYGLDLATGEQRQYTNVVTGAFMPAVLKAGTGEEHLVYGGFWKGSFDIYEANTGEPLAKETVPVTTASASEKDLAHFEPDISVSVDQSNKEKYRGFKFFLEDAEAYAGVQSNQTYVGRVLLTFSDYLGDKRIVVDLSAIESFSNFNLIYADLSHRLQWEASAFDNRVFFIGQDLISGRIVRGQQAIEETGAMGTIIYPFSFYHRMEVGLGYEVRKINLQDFVIDPATGGQIPTIVPSNDNFPVLTAALVGDSTQGANWGAIAGRRWRIDTLYAPNINGKSGLNGQKGGSTLYDTVELDFRQYVPVTLRSNLAVRVFGGVSAGSRPTPFYFGGLDTVRGVDLFTLVGDRAFFGNLEYRFPLIDLLATPVLGFRGIRGIVFFDIGGAWFKQFQKFVFWDSKTHRLVDATASYGWGVSVNLLGLEVNWDFAKITDLKSSQNFRTQFWVGARF
jgi:outer membrane protein assembly factor BamB